MGLPPLFAGAGVGFVRARALLLRRLALGPALRLLSACCSYTTTLCIMRVGALQSAHLL